MIESLIDKLRLGPWLLAAIAMAAVVGWFYPHQLGVLLWSLTKLSFGAYLGYWIDRSLFPYARPGNFTYSSAHSMTAWAMLMLRRAIIIAAALIALGLGV